MKHLLPLLVLLALLFTASLSRADDAADKAQLTDITKRTAAALVSGDLKALKSVYADDWKVVGPDGQILTREQVFATLGNTDFKFTSYEVSDLDIHIYGDTAIVVGHGDPKGQMRGDQFELHETFSDTFVRLGGEWRCILSHTSERQ